MYPFSWLYNLTFVVLTYEIYKKKMTIGYICTVHEIYGAHYLYIFNQKQSDKVLFLISSLFSLS